MLNIFESRRDLAIVLRLLTLSVSVLHPLLPLLISRAFIMQILADAEEFTRLASGINP
jgi:hypothetical protein